MMHDTYCHLNCKCGNTCRFIAMECSGNHQCLFCFLKNSWTVYVLQCKDGTLYTGITKDLDKRIKLHNEGKGAKYTKGRGPVTLIHKFGANDKSEALKLEHKIKNLSKSEKLSLDFKKVKALCALQ